MSPQQLQSRNRTLSSSSNASNPPSNPARPASTNVIINIAPKPVVSAAAASLPLANGAAAAAATQNAQMSQTPVATTGTISQIAGKLSLGGGTMQQVGRPMQQMGSPMQPIGSPMQQMASPMQQMSSPMPARGVVVPPVMTGRTAPLNSPIGQQQQPDNNPGSVPQQQQMIQQGRSPSMPSNVASTGLQQLVARDDSPPELCPPIMQMVGSHNIIIHI